MFASERYLIRVLALLFLTSFGVPFSNTSFATPTPVDDPECAKLIARLEKTLRSIPKDMAGIKSERADQMAKDVIQGTRDADSFLKKCADHDRVAEVHFFKMKFLHLMSTRARYDALRQLPKTGGRVEVGALERALRPFYENLLSHADKAYKGLPKESGYRPEALEIRGWTHLKLTDYVSARNDYTKYLGDYPKSDRRGDVTAALSRVYLEVKAYDAGIELLKQALVDPRLLDSPTYPHFGDMLWKLNEAKGDFNGMADAADRVLSLFPFRAKGKGLKARTLEMYERTIDISGFRRPYVDFARGNFQDARKGFLKHVEVIDAKQKGLKKKGQDLKPVSSIFRERSRRCANFIDKFVGKAAPTDFKLDGYWVTERRSNLATSKGKVLAVVFRGVDDLRSATFLSELDEFATDDDKIELLTVSYLHRAKNADKQVDAFRRELVDLDYESSAGFDPDPVAKPLFRTYGAYVGSASFMIFDQEGQPVWFQQDPRTIDVNVAKSILKDLRDRR